MNTGILAEQVRLLDPGSAIEQENCLQELLQQYVLASLSRARFFSLAAFHGGTCLRILHGAGRFSEDLDFLLRVPLRGPQSPSDAEFDWRPYLQRIRDDLLRDDIHVEVQSHDSNSAVKKAWIKAGGTGHPLGGNLPFPRREAKKIRIKLEVDANPPAGSILETRYITFPITVPITVQNLESGFAGKSHALLCRPYTKGRDWYDFLWYLGKGIVPLLPFLSNAIQQQGPWAGQGIDVTPEWYVSAMRARIEEIDWVTARADVSRFVVLREQRSIEQWGPHLFLQFLERMVAR
ncbi:MAG: nucleotidyl transferase AbiEii/AbiGii toxin family protein [Candidatus Eisenbacteria sp.]|nr:nucleotidyl transferase AbiEii/AbiGii toxin family protein [Candidatus Eisenbacteria bacterium]